MIKPNNVEKLKSMLPFLSELFSFHFQSQPNENKEILSILSMCKLCTLSTSRLKTLLTCPSEILSIKTLTVTFCLFTELNQLFKYIPMLEYLDTKVFGLESNDTISLENNQAVHLKKLIIQQFQEKFQYFQMLIKRVPNLKNLTIFGAVGTDKIVASLWEDLIRSSLPFLNILKFELDYCRSDVKDVFVPNLQQFQSDFWQKEHH